jgi:hypothetical protein
MSTWPSSHPARVSTLAASLTGLALLIVPNEFMEPTQRMIHTVEILTRTRRSARPSCC